MSLELIIGCMFSGKSTELIRRIRRFQSIGKSVCVLNHNNDTRTEDKVETHYGDGIHSLKYTNLMNFVNTIQDNDTYDVICIDEAQFFGDLLVGVKVLVDVQRYHVIIAGLSGDYRRNNFGDIHKLIPLADDIQLCKAYCGICKDVNVMATNTKRIAGGKELVEVGASDKYVAVCRNCYFKN